MSKHSASYILRKSRVLLPVRQWKLAAGEFPSFVQAIEVMLTWVRGCQVSEAGGVFVCHSSSHKCASNDMSKKHPDGRKQHLPSQPVAVQHPRLHPWHERRVYYLSKRDWKFYGCDAQPDLVEIGKVEKTCCLIAKRLHNNPYHANFPFLSHFIIKYTRLLYDLHMSKTTLSVWQIWHSAAALNWYLLPLFYWYIGLLYQREL